MESNLLAIVLTIIGTIFGALGGFVFKKASGKFKFSSPKSYPQVIAGFLLFGISAGFYIVALSKGDLSLLYPMTSLTYVWVAVLAKRYLREEISFYRWLGIVLIVIGSIILAQ
ncbi:MAG: EamA family transporter [Nanoarchaeota archaeon]